MSGDKDCKCGTLYVVATPIGNLEDITLRAVRILGEVDLIAAEDTRHTRKLLSHLSISKPLVSYYKDRESSRSEKIIEELLSGRNVALVSDAGTPAISDPGAILVSHCHEKSIPVIAVPGPSALTAALSVAGLTLSSFIFLGFLPSKKSQRMKTLIAHVQDEPALVFYESPRRVSNTLAECREVFGERKVFIGRELTKIYEELLTGTLSEVLRVLVEKSQIKGEFVVIVFPDQKSNPAAPEDIEELLCWYKDNSDLSMKDSVKKIARDLNLSRSLVYEKALYVWAKK
ncbi:MAG: 16S rRNA (cytidine(1402)-2'-O)-methyltransferase [Desulfobulbaceae bacterium]|nr:16S rRNA (cytidine(1402)-2'-O)-methyltransferase [Pseudomonadota bacterium]MCG2746689.1 16S rRNA (cytidine(1402)-2'-O)-methyltransferase [Desulfobulbaceae bacterium]